MGDGVTDGFSPHRLGERWVSSVIVLEKAVLTPCNGRDGGARVADGRSICGGPDGVTDILDIPKALARGLVDEDDARGRRKCMT